MKSTVEKLIKSYPSAKDRVSGHAANLGDYTKLEQTLTELFEKIGKLDHVIYTAGDPLAMMKIDSIDIDKVLKAGTVRFFGPLILSKIAPRYLSGGPKSSITLTTGSVSEKPRPDWAVINGFATGLQGLTRGLALDLKPIRVNLVSPGAVDTELWSHMTEQQKEDLKKRIVNSVPTGRFGRVEDVAESYLYLLKDENVTGSMISTNSGALLV